MSLSPSLMRIKRICQRRRTGNDQEPEDVAWLIDAVACAMKNGDSIDYHLDLRGRWGHRLRNEDFSEALFELSPESRPMDRNAAEAIVKKLNRYKLAAYSKNLKNEIFPQGDDGCLHKVLLRFGGEVPAADTIRKYHATHRKSGDTDRLSVPKTTGNKAA